MTLQADCTAKTVAPNGDLLLMSDTTCYLEIGWPPALLWETGSSSLLRDCSRENGEKSDSGH
jgi:hypothetical protein